jgi:hypothetical protein
MDMMLSGVVENLKSGGMRVVAPVVLALFLSACGGTPAGPPLPQTDATGEPIQEADDVAIAGQMAAHAIIEQPEIAGATKPPMVRFKGVTSDLATPVDTEPYTDLLRDRLLLITREKLRFEEHTLPPLHGHKVGPAPDADYQLTAVLGADAGPDTYLVRIEFIDLHAGQPVFNGLYRIRPEATAPPDAAPVTGAPGTESTAPMPNSPDNSPPSAYPPPSSATPVNL